MYERIWTDVVRTVDTPRHIPWRGPLPYHGRHIGFDTVRDSVCLGTWGAPYPYSVPQTTRHNAGRTGGLMRNCDPRRRDQGARVQAAGDVRPTN